MLPRSRVRPAALALGIALACSGAARVRAQPGGKPPPEAVEFYERGVAHYKGGRYRQAIDELERALMLAPASPALLYNLAKVYELMGDHNNALRYYSDYLRLLPASEVDERERVNVILERLRGARDSEESQTPPGQQRSEDTPTEPPAPPPEAPRSEGTHFESKRGVMDTTFWATVGAASAVFVTGVGLGAAALRRDNEVEAFVLGADGTLDDRSALQSKADRLALGADLLLIAGLAGGVGATLLYLLRTESREVLPSGATAGVAVTPHGAVVTYGGRL
jgi:tetratricopeptide (TPR) repeat protein